MKGSEIFRRFVVFALMLGLITANFSFAKEIVVRGFIDPLDGQLRCVNGEKDIVVPFGERFVLPSNSWRVIGWYHGYGWREFENASRQEIKVEMRTMDYVLPPVNLILRFSEKKKHRDFDLRFLAVSAPYWISSSGVPESRRLDSRTPFSLQNAVRLGAHAALAGDEIWGCSNWSDSELLKDSVLILNYWEEDVDFFKAKLSEIKPNILFIGSMTLSFPGAVRLASIAKDMLGEKVFIVLGGKQVNETIYLRKGSAHHHVGSPTLLMQQNRIPSVFDLVVAGDGEEVIRCIGECFGKELINSEPFSAYVDSFKNLRGKFILSWIENGEIQSFSSNGQSLDYNALPSPVSIFGADSSFPIFDTAKTAHVYSDMGKGCVFNCFFCSEKSGVNGKIFKDDPALRLYHQLEDAAMAGDSMSAFIEDSIILSGNEQYLNRLADLLESQPLGIPFGGQFTVDNLLDSGVRQAITRLSSLGLSYVYTGMETFNEEVAVGFSKNTARRSSWIERNLEAIKFLAEHQIKYGVAVLWGLGENQTDRLAHLDFLIDCKANYGIPAICSLNWATRHPLFDQSPFDYVEWGTEKESEYLPFFVRMFGEASERYSFPNAPLPPVADLLVLEKKFKEFLS